MSRFKNYILGNEEEEFIALSVGLVDKQKSQHQKTIKNIQEKYNIGTDIINIVDDLNKNLNKVYKGKFKFDFCLDSSIVLEDIKQLRNRNIENLKLKFYDVSGELSKIKTQIERKIK